MALLLNIDTATEHASVCITRDDTLLGMIESSDQKNHAAFLQPAIAQLVRDTGIALTEIDAVAATAGPGSYTGLRVGLSSAKGICYALDKKLVLVDTLKVMAMSILSYFQENSVEPIPGAVIRPLIDARRMEVFTALYDLSLTELEAPNALVLDSHAFENENRAVYFVGSGQEKLKSLISAPQKVFTQMQHNARHLSMLAQNLVKKGVFTDLAYSEPLYVKGFFDTSKAGK